MAEENNDRALRALTEQALRGRHVRVIDGVIVNYTRWRLIWSSQSWPGETVARAAAHGRGEYRYRIRWNPEEGCWDVYTQRAVEQTYPHGYRRLPWEHAHR